MRAAVLAKAWIDYSLDRVGYKLDSSAWPQPRAAHASPRCRKKPVPRARRRAAAANGRTICA